MFAIRYYPNLDVTEGDAANATSEEIRELDAAIRDGIVKAGTIGYATIFMPFMMSQWRQLAVASAPKEDVDRITSKCDNLTQKMNDRLRWNLISLPQS
jgi:hypothetical protein